MDIKTIVTGDLQTNTYLIIDTETGDAVLVDPAAETHRIIAEIEESKANLKAIMITHGHFDHIGAVDEVALKLGVPVVTHSKEAEMMKSSKDNLSLYFFGSNIVASADTHIEDGDFLDFGGKLKFKCLIVSGHTSHSVCFYNENQQFVITGDTLMSGSIGRTDFYQSNNSHLINNIEEKIMSLPVETIVYPGHGYPTEIIVEKETNPYF